jgi:hypothetical protein
MAILKHIKRLKYIDYLIKRKATGDLEKFASKNGLSKRAMSDVLNEMKELGFPIKYDRTRYTYYYDERGEMVKNLFIKDGQFLTKEQVAQIGQVDNLCFSEVTIFKICENF